MSGTPKVAVTHSGETKRKWQNKGCKTWLYYHVRRDLSLSYPEGLHIEVKLEEKRRKKT